MFEVLCVTLSSCLFNLPKTHTHTHTHAVSSAERNLVTASLPAAARRALLKSKEFDKIDTAQVLRAAGELIANAHLHTADRGNQRQLCE
jgi:hypothetical protein